MANDYDNNIYSTVQHCKELKWTNGIYDNQPTDITNCDSGRNINEDVNNNDRKECKPLISLLSVCGIKTEEHLPMDVTSDEVSFKSKEWEIIDPCTRKSRAPRQHEFLLKLLDNKKYSSYISWQNKAEGSFKIHQPQRVATLWTRVKNRHTNGYMDYETFARGIRYYYSSGIMIKTNRKHTFRFKSSLISGL